jgi:hypothetical protein
VLAAPVTPRRNACESRTNRPTWAYKRQRFTDALASSQSQPSFERVDTSTRRPLNLGRPRRRDGTLAERLADELGAVVRRDQLGGRPPLDEALEHADRQNRHRRLQGQSNRPLIASGQPASSPSPESPAPHASDRDSDNGLDSIQKSGQRADLGSCVIRRRTVRTPAPAASRRARPAAPCTRDAGPIRRVSEGPRACARRAAIRAPGSFR